MSSRALVLSAATLLLAGATGCAPEMDSGPGGLVGPVDTSSHGIEGVTDFSGTWTAVSRTYYDDVVEFPHEAGAVSGAWTLEVLPDRTAGTIEVTPEGAGDNFTPYTLDASFVHEPWGQVQLTLDASPLDYVNLLDFTCSFDEPSLDCVGGAEDLGDLTFHR